MTTLSLDQASLIVDTALEIQRSFGPDWFGVETNQFQQLLAAELLRKANERRMMMPLCTINNQVNKQVRIRRLTPHLARHRIRFKGDSPGARLLVEQLRDFRPHFLAVGREFRFLGQDREVHVDHLPLGAANAMLLDDQFDAAFIGDGARAFLISDSREHEPQICAKICAPVGECLDEALV